jgi:hypothetical protein
VKKRFGPCLPIPVEQDLSRLVQDAQIHGPGVQVDATRKLMWLGAESHGVSSSAKGRLLNASSPTVVCRGGGLNKYQPRPADALQRPLPSRFRARLTRSVRQRCDRTTDFVFQEVRR